MSASFALLADGRFPSGGHAHSFGYEAASREWALDSTEGVASFIEGRLHSTGRTEASLIAAVSHEIRTRQQPNWSVLDAEAEARIISGALRAASRALGRQWLRAGGRVWPGGVAADLFATVGGPHQVLALAAVGSDAGLGTYQTVLLHLHHLVSGITTAAVRLHGLDPFEMSGVTERFGETLEALAEEATENRAMPLADVSAWSGPLTEILAEEHAAWDSRLFQS